MSLVEGALASVTMTVEATMTAATFARQPEEEFPNVLATPFLLGEMERAAAKLMRSLLQDGQISVGTNVDLAHLAPTPIGATLTSSARYLRQEGPIFWFEVWAEDRGGVVGKGRHGRAIVAADSVEPRAARRIGNG